MKSRLLHIGCFGSPADGWHNTDITPHIWISRIPGMPVILRSAGMMTKERFREHQAGVFRKVHYLDATKRFPYKDSSFDGAFCSHILEHIHRRFVRQFFDEVFRVLAPGGIFRVVVPSLEQAIRAYRADDPTECLAMIFENDHASSKNTHKWMYTEESLVRLFKDAHFVGVEAQSFRSGRLRDLSAVDNRPENSIYIEGGKPSPGLQY